MGTGELGVNVKNAIDSFIGDLPDPTAGWETDLQRLNLQKSIMNEVEDWREYTIILSDSNQTLSDLTHKVTRVILPATGITQNITVTLPTLADNLDKELIFENLNSSYYINIDGEGSETVNGTLNLKVYGGFLKIRGYSDEWKSLSEIKGSVTGSAVGAVRSGILYYTFYINKEGKTIFKYWGFGETSGTGNNGYIIFTLPVAFSHVEYMVGGLTGYKSVAVDPTSLQDVVLQVPASEYLTIGFHQSNVNIRVAFYKPSGNFPNNWRWTFSGRIEGIV